MKKLVCTFDPDDADAIRYAVEIGQPVEIRAAIEHAASGFRSRLRRLDGAEKMLIYKPATAFDAAVAQLVLQQIADDEGRVLEIQWLPNPNGFRSPDIEWRKS